MREPRQRPWAGFNGSSVGHVRARSSLPLSRCRSRSRSRSRSRCHSRRSAPGRRRCRIGSRSRRRRPQGRRLRTVPTTGASTRPSNSRERLSARAVEMPAAATSRTPSTRAASTTASVTGSTGELSRMTMSADSARCRKSEAASAHRTAVRRDSGGCVPKEARAGHRGPRYPSRVRGPPRSGPLRAGKR